MIIGLSGYAGAGKDTAALMIQWLTYRERMRKLGKEEHSYPFSVWGNLSAEVREYNRNWKIKKYADPLRKVAHVFLPQYTLEFLYTDEFKVTVLGPEWRGMTGREFLQKLGTDAVRNHLHANAWVNALMAEYKPYTIEEKEHWKGHAINIGDSKQVLPNWIISDMRFPNEVDNVYNHMGITVRIYRKEIQQLNHESETALENADFDFYYDNSSLSLDDMQAWISDALAEFILHEQ